MKKIYIISAILILVAQTALLSQSWEKVYTGIYSRNNRAGTQITSDGGYILVGYGPNQTQTHHQAFLLKTNAFGDLIWSKTFSVSTNIVADVVIETGDGFLIGGSIFDPSSSFLLKVDLNGNTLWTKTYSGVASIEMIQKTTNGFILLGNRAGGSGFFCAKINNVGSIIWTKTFGTSELSAKGIAPAENNGFILIGKKQSNTYGRGNECYIMKFDSIGTMLWANSYGYQTDFTPNSIKLLNSGDYIIGGTILMKINKDGNLLWVKQWYGTTIRDINQTADNGFIIAAGGYWNIDGIYLYKVSFDGTPQWEKVFGESQDQTTNVFITEDNGFLISGSHGDQLNNFGGLYLIKTDSTGSSGCNTRAVTLIPNKLYPSLCIINNITFPLSSNYLASNLAIASNPVAINVVNPCCFAKAQIITDTEYLCSGDPIRYVGSGGPHLQWYNGDTSSNIVTLDTMVYLTVTNTCGSFTDTLIVPQLGFVPSFTFNINIDTICRGDSVLLNITGNAPTYYCSGKYVKNVNDTTFLLKPTETSNYTVIGTTGSHGYPGCKSQQIFTIYVSPDKPIITKIVDTLFSSSPINNQWFFNGNSISGAINSSLIINQFGSYTVEVIDEGCSNVSDNFSYAPDSVVQDTIVYVRDAWQKMIKSEGNGVGNCVVQADDGGLIIGGSYYLGNNNYSPTEDVSLIKIDRNGELIWNKTYGGSGADHINSIIKVNNGYVAVGSTNSFGNGNNDVYIISFGQQGQLLWSKTYGDWNNQEGNSIEETSDGGFIVTGYSTHPNSYSVTQDGWLIDDNDLYLLKIDSNGNLLWSKTFDASNNERGIEAHETDDGNYIIAGTSKYKVYILKTDANGNLLWSEKIGNSSNLTMTTTSMKVTPDNNYLICINTSNGGHLLKLDDNGNILWSKLVHDVAWGKSLVITNDNAAVFTSGFGYGNDHGSLTKIDMNGDLIWSTNYYSSTQQYVSAMEQLSDGSFLLTGAIDTLNHYGPGQIYLINADVDGQTNCSQSFYPTITNEPFTFFPHTTTVSTLGNEINASTNFYASAFQSRTFCQSVSFVAAPVTSNITICSGNTASLSAVGIGTLGWYSEPIGGIYLGGGTNFITTSLTTNTTYFVQDSTPIGISSRKAVMVTVNPSPPPAPFATNSIICSSSNTALLTATGIGTIGWYSEAMSGTYLGGGINYLTPFLTTSTTYYVQDSTCAASSMRTAVLVTIDSLVPEAPVAPNITICSGGTASLTAAGIGTCGWYSAATSGIFLGGGPNFITSALTTNSTYYVQDSTCAGSSTRSAVLVIVNPLPDVTANASVNTVCAGTTVTLTGGGATFYTWSGSIMNGVSFVLSSSTTYTVTGKDANNCSNIATTTINVNPLPNVSTHLNGFSITANQTEAAYQWLDCNNGLSPIEGETNQTYTATINGNYAVIVSMNGCSDTSACVNFNITSINEIVNNNDQLLIFPNPGNGVITVALSGTEGQSTTELSYTIINESGQEIQLFELNSSNKFSINIENLSNGIYFIVGFNNNQMVRQKVVVLK